MQMQPKIDNSRAICRDIVVKLGLAAIVEGSGGESLIQEIASNAKDFFEDRFNCQYTGEAWQDILVARETILLLATKFQKEISIALDLFKGTDQAKKALAEVERNMNPAKHASTSNFVFDPAYWSFKILPADQRDCVLYRLFLVSTVIDIENTNHKDKIQKFIDKAKSIVQERAGEFPSL